VCRVLTVDAMMGPIAHELSHERPIGGLVRERGETTGRPWRSPIVTAVTKPPWRPAM
jgi:hypothetical protein